MQNIFDHWNIEKQKINKKNTNHFPKVWEIWYCNLGYNIGYEENGKWDVFKRPVLVLNRLWNIYLCIAMTSKGKDNNKYYIKVYKNSYVITSQVRTLDSKRFLQPLIKIPYTQFQGIQKELKEQRFSKP